MDPSVRILVLGDSGVGKTSLVELVCSGEELQKPRSTVGCAIHMKIHESRATVVVFGRLQRERYLILCVIGSCDVN